jgi:molybdate transport system substrate-binding protein
MSVHATIFTATSAAMFICLASVGAAKAAEIKILSVNGVKLVLGEVAGAFERSTGHKVTISLDEAGVLRRHIEGGEAFDVAILPRPATDEFVKQGKLASGSPVDVARAVFGFGVRSGASTLDTSSPDAFKRSLLAARTIVYTDPATGGVSGVFFARVLERLGIADAVGPRCKLTAGVLNAKFVASGEADIAFQMKHEILAIPGVEFVALPPEHQSGAAVVFTASMRAGASQSGAAKEFIQFLSGPVAAPLIKAKGMEPG